MTIKSDKWIKKMAQESRLIDPFIDKQVKHTEEAGSTVSYGLSSYGYDVRCSNEFKVFTIDTSSNKVAIVSGVLKSSFM